MVSSCLVLGQDSRRLELSDEGGELDIVTSVEVQFYSRRMCKDE
jgi:hypothetical protein